MLQDKNIMLQILDDIKKDTESVRGLSFEVTRLVEEDKKKKDLIIDTVLNNSKLA